jgi:hypothetical protein
MMNNISIDEGRRESPARCVDQAVTGNCQQVPGDGSSIPNPDAEVSSVSSASVSIGAAHDVANATTGAGRSELDDWRIAFHEAGHVVCGRALGEEVGGVTIVEGPDYGGLTWGPKGNSSRLKIASMICTGETAIDAYLAFGLAEAKALIEQHRAAVWAIAEALMVHRTLDSTQIDNIITAAPELARRAKWAKVIANAAEFSAGLESRQPE